MTLFLILGGAGVALLLLALLIGDVLEGALNFDAISMLDSDVFSTAGVAGLVGGFGFGGALGLALSKNMVVAIVVGVLVGVVFAWIAGRLTGFFKRSESGSVPSSKSMIGTEARVLTPIPQSGFGQIRFTHNGHLMTMNARCDIAMDAGARVWISGLVSSTAVEVRPVPLEDAPQF